MSWSVLFGVTACSCIAFSTLIKLMDGEHSPLFLKTGLVAGACWILNRLVVLLKKIPANKGQHS
ncbi:MAG: hypothetical protein JNM88_05770 [Chitinophagaceae bacterium]|nr:hypothetical protein [Chitinophagaceae bacterium]